MSLSAKALFVIERNLSHDLSLESVAASCEVSRYHLAHAFAVATGRTVMDYIRARRLTEAARGLAKGAPNILDVALASGYTSHEAFSRAFRNQFNTTPEKLRQRGSLDGVSLTEVMIVPAKQTVELPPPTFKSVGEQLFVGLAAKRRMGEAAMIPAQWREFMTGPYQRVSHRVDEPPVGVTLPGESDDEFIYVCGAPVSRFGGTPKELIEVTVAPAEYAVFAHDGHVSELPQTYAAIWNDWFPSSGKMPKRAPSLEHHNPTFDPRTGMGGVTVWIPLAG